MGKTKKYSLTDAADTKATGAGPRPDPSSLLTIIRTEASPVVAVVTLARVILEGDECEQ